MKRKPKKRAPAPTLPAGNFPAGALVLQPERERSVVLRHPWVYSGAVWQRPEAENGAIVPVLDSNGKWLATGFYSDQSQIVCRLFEFKSQDQDFESDEYWLAKIGQALESRKAISLPNDKTDCYRLIHAEGDNLPGLVLDIYGRVAVAQVLTKATERLWPQLAKAIYGQGIEHIYLKIKENTTFLEDVSLESGWHNGTNGPEEIEILENGMRFKLNVLTGQKTGFFLDQRDARHLLRSLSQGKTVVNTFSYTGGFSVAALMGGATRVVSVDISKEAIRLANENALLNGFEKEHEAVVSDCFDYLRDLTEEFDIMVLDPPAFAKNARSVDKAARGYKELNLKAFKKIKAGGILFTFSCSQHIDRDLFRKIIFGAAADARRPVRILYQTTQPPDHPVNIYHPEGEYLKGLVVQVY